MTRYVSTSGCTPAVYQGLRSVKIGYNGLMPHRCTSLDNRTEGEDRGETEGGVWLSIPELRQEYRYPRCEFSPCIPTT